MVPSQVPRPSSRRAELVPGVAAAALLVLALAAPARAQDRALATLTAAASRYQEIQTVCASFRQVLTVALLGERNESRGELCQQRPNLFFMRFAEPAGDEVVADGTWFWVYYPSMNPGQVIRLPLDPARGGLDFYREFLENPADKYEATFEGEEEFTGRATHRIALKPRAPRGYRMARVWIDPREGMIRGVEVTEDNGTTRFMTLDRIRIDPAVGADAFTFRVPAGARVISR